MSFIQLVIIGFIALETANVIALYFFPGSKLANSIGVFKSWEISKHDPEMHSFVKYLVNWVAGSKLIFILLLAVILFTADERTLGIVGLVMALAIASFYWRLFPLIRKMDRHEQVDPKNYASVLGWMIFVFVLVFAVSAVMQII